MRFSGDVGDVLGVVEESHRVVITPEQQDRTLELDEPLQRGAAPVRVVPRLLREEIPGLPAPGDEARDVMG